MVATVLHSLGSLGGGRVSFPREGLDLIAPGIERSALPTDESGTSSAVGPRYPSRCLLKLPFSSIDCKRASRMRGQISSPLASALAASGTDHPAQCLRERDLRDLRIGRKQATGKHTASSSQTSNAQSAVCWWWLQLVAAVSPPLAASGVDHPAQRLRERDARDVRLHVS